MFAPLIYRSLLDAYWCFTGPPSATPVCKGRIVVVVVVVVEAAGFFEMFVIARRSARCHDRRSHSAMNIRSDSLKTLVLKVFRLFRKIAKSGCYFRHVCLSVRFQGTVRLSLDEFSWNWYLRNCRKSVEKMHVSLKSDKNDGYFTRRPM